MFFWFSVEGLDTVFHCDFSLTMPKKSGSFSTMFCLDSIKIPKMKCFKYAQVADVIILINAGINFIHNHPPRAPPAICTKNLPPPWGFCILAFARRAGICWGSSRGAGICQKTIFAIFGIFIVMARIDSTLGFICCSESLYVFKTNYSNLD